MGIPKEREGGNKNTVGESLEGGKSLRCPEASVEEADQGQE